MANPSLQTAADTAVDAVSTVATCLPATAVLLKELLFTKDKAPGPRSTKTTTNAQSNAPAAEAGRKRAKTICSSPRGLSVKEKATTATRIVNAALRALGDVAKSKPCAALIRREGPDDVARAPSKRMALRRSSSVPTTPLQPRSLNRVSTTPATIKQMQTAAIDMEPSNENTTNLMALVECCRVAFASMRTLLSTGKIILPELQLETGMSAFIAKLIAIGLNDQAVKELRILKRRLQFLSRPEIKSAAKLATESKLTSPSHVIADILDLGPVHVNGQALSLVVNTQLQALRILSALKRPALVEAAMPYLQQDCASSPTNLLLLLAKDETVYADKTARQMEILSQCLLSLTPGVSTKDDSIACEPRLSVSAMSSIHLQVLGLESRLHWWRIANHRGDVEKDVLFPLLKCFAALERRVKDSAALVYDHCQAAYARIHGLMEAQESFKTSVSSKSATFRLFQMLTSQAQEAGRLAESVAWATKTRGEMAPESETEARRSSAAAQLLALQLKDPMRYLTNEKLLDEVVTSIRAPVQGGGSELDELLANFCLVRKSAMAVLNGQVKAQMSPVTKGLLVTLILQFPRFCLRWLGKPPEAKSSTKALLRFEQRRKHLTKSVQPVVDSALLILKKQLEGDCVEWEMVEPVLQDCLMLLDYIGDLGTSVDIQSFHHVKISHIYYMQYNALRKQTAGVQDATLLRALRRSTDCVKYCSRELRERAQLNTKLELLADVCKSLGRSKEAVGALQQIRWGLVEDGVLMSVAKALAAKPPGIAWAMDAQAELLSRTLTGIAQLEHVWVDWTPGLDEDEKAAVHEHRLYFAVLEANGNHGALDLQDPAVTFLLRTYVPSRFPMRRLRMLLRLLCVVGKNDDGLQEDLRVMALDALQAGENGDTGEDQPLAAFVPHWKVFYRSLCGLLDSDLDIVKQSVATWKTMASSCRSKEALEEKVDDLPGLLSHLQSIADFLDMKGHDGLRSAVLELSANFSALSADSEVEHFVLNQSSFALQCVLTGQTSRADGIFHLVKDFTARRDSIAGETVASFHLAYSEYYLIIGDITRAEEQLGLAKAASAQPSRRSSRLLHKANMAHASYLFSILALEYGDAHDALTHAKNSARSLCRDWARLEAQFSKATGKEDEDTVYLNSSWMTQPATKSGTLSGPAFWKLAPSLIHRLLHLSYVYAHLGMFTETTHYAEQAHKIARSASSEMHEAQCATWLATTFAQAEKIKEAAEMVAMARSRLPSDGRSYRCAQLACRLAKVYMELKDAHGEADMLAAADDMIRKTAEGQDDKAALQSGLARLNLEEQPGELKASSKKDVDNTRTRKTSTCKAVPIKKATARTAKTAGRIARTTVRKTTTKAKPAATASNILGLPDHSVQDVMVSNVRASILVQKALSSVTQRDWKKATEILDAAKQLSKLPRVALHEQLTRAACLLEMGMDLMAHDPVFSVIHDSTISFPSVSGADVRGDKHSPISGRKAAATKMYAEHLKGAYELLVETHSNLTTTGASGLLRRVSSMLQNVSLLLSTTAANDRTCSLQHHATLCMEVARSLTWLRERKMVMSEKKDNSKMMEPTEFPSFVPRSDSARRSSLGLLLDWSRTQREYVDILPESWTVIEVGLVETGIPQQHDLSIVKLRAGQPPFTLRLPLDRAISRDADNEVFGFDQGRAELLDVIQKSNASCHDKRNMKLPENRKDWWAGRRTLNERLEALLHKIETVWLGGFRGVFSQHRHRPGLLAVFAQALQGVLDKYLPSRRQVVRGAGRARRTKGASTAASASAMTTSSAAASNLALDARVLELFIGLGDATAQDCDFDEALNDLLYLVVDILQFHGERNAYDEIDFDSMVVEVFDALRAYHSAAAASPDTADCAPHTILVLDQALHAFPWESMSCLRDSAVSRVPNLPCLKRLIVDARRPGSSTGSTDEKKVAESFHHAPGHYVSGSSGTFILNPAGDLTSTQSTFEGPLNRHLSSASASGWTAIVARAPTQDEYSSALTRSDTLLYCGHGSGAQYMASRNVRLLQKCRATVLLMGCSSALLKYYGTDFEPSGTVWDYMHAGSPAVVGTLWDVTDRDIDRFAGSMLELWGMLPQHSFADPRKTSGTASRAVGITTPRVKKHADPGDKGEDGSEVGQDDDAARPNMSLVEAVTCARKVCNFRYLTAGATVVYGIPVYVEKVADERYRRRDADADER